MENSTEDEDSCFLEAEEEEKGRYRYQHEQSGNSSKKCGCFEGVVKDGVEVDEGAAADVDGPGVVGVAVGVGTHMTVSEAFWGITNPLGLNKRDHIENTPDDG